jgi:hypothetical protein
MMDEFSKRPIVIFTIVMIAATALTVEATYYAVKTFIFDDANDSMVKAGGLSSDQKEAGKVK